MITMSKKLQEIQLKSFYKKLDDTEINLHGMKIFNFQMTLIQNGDVWNLAFQSWNLALCIYPYWIKLILKLVLCTEILFNVLFWQKCSKTDIERILKLVKLSLNCQ